MQCDFRQAPGLLVHLCDRVVRRLSQRQRETVGQRLSKDTMLCLRSVIVHLALASANISTHR